jgi:hypothetical protein
MDPNEIIRPQTEQTVWVYTQGKNIGQVAPEGDKDAKPVIRTTVYRRDGRVEVWQRNPDQGPEFGALMPAPVSYTDDKIAAEFQRAQDKADSTAGTKEGDIRGPQTGPTREVYRGGQWVVEPNPIYQAPADQQEKPPREGDTRGPQTGPKREVYRGGQWVTEANPTYQQSQSASKQEAVPGYPGWTSRTDKDANGNELTVYYAPGSTTPQRALPEKPDAPTKPTYQTIKGGDGQEYIRSITIGADGKPVIQTYGPNGQPVASIPGEREKPSMSQVRGEDGQVYTTVTTIGPDNKPTVQTFGPNGQTVDRIPTKADAKYTQIITDKETGRLYGLTRDGKMEPVEGDPNAKPQTGSAGPKLPELVVGMSQAALRGYKEQLQAEVAAGGRRRPGPTPAGKRPPRWRRSPSRSPRSSSASTRPISTPTSTWPRAACRP